jgi:hypothetical protein
MVRRGSYARSSSGWVTAGARLVARPASRVAADRDVATFGHRYFVSGGQQMLVRRPMRVVAVAVLAMLALTAAAGCQNRFGAAAFVGDDRISTGQVDNYVKRVVSDPVYGGQLDNDRDSVRAVVVMALVQNKLLGLSAAQLGVPVSDGQVAAASADPGVRNKAQGLRLPVELYARNFLTYGAIAHKLVPSYDPTAQQVNSQLAQSIAIGIRTQIDPVMAANPVTVNPEYGVFYPQNLEVKTANDAAPQAEPWIRPLSNEPSPVTS